ncbi:MAG: class I mannose-6-phosphate isomerase [Phycisphaerales bacterium]|nr:MAG: class I mannose-6-phosphate isomerase [Phycisphaerales bacterium]
MDVYPLIFEPIFRRKIWGGCRLDTNLHKRLPEGEPTGESWEIADLEDDQSVVANGPAKGTTLGELVQSWATDLVGHAPLFEGRFPLLIKYLDANDTLSVQVHPDEAMARKLGGRVRVKNEAWYIIDTTDDGFIYRGVREGVSADVFKGAIESQDLEAVLKRINVKKGQCYYLPSGTIHALGAGVLVAEVQTPSDITYRVYDWNRVDPTTGAPRELHLQQALQCISYDTRPIAGESVEHVANVWATVTKLVRCESFAIDCVRLTEGLDQEVSTGEFLIWMVLEGNGVVTCNTLAEPTTFTAGDTVLLPAGLKQTKVQTHSDCIWIEVAYPIPSSPTGFGDPRAGALEQPVSPSD